MTAARGLRKPAKDSRASQPSRSGVVSCKTCSVCRQKKLKCDGSRPKCRECETNEYDCVYPRDARREARPSGARVQSLEKTVALMLEHMKASGHCSTPYPLGFGQRIGHGCHRPRPDLFSGSRPILPRLQQLRVRCRHRLRQRRTIPKRRPIQRHSPAATHIDSSMREEASASFGPMLFGPSQDGPHQASALEDTSIELGRDQDTSNADDVDDCGRIAGLSPCEARVAGVFHENGCVSSVHGLARHHEPDVSRATQGEHLEACMERRRCHRGIQGSTNKQRRAPETA